MSEIKEKKVVTFTDHLSILWKWKKFLIINLLVITIITTGLSFLIHKTYRSTATVMIPPDNSMGLGGLGSLFSGSKSALSIGASVFGTASTSEDLILGLLYSRGILAKIIDKYNLIDYYEVRERSFDLTLKEFLNDLNFDTNEFGFIEVSVINKDPEMSAKIANDFVKLADSININLNIETARRNRVFVEKRYLQNIADLQKAEIEFEKFQKKHGVFDVPEQVKVAIQSLGTLETEVIKKEIMLAVIKESFSNNSKQVKDLDAQINAMKNKINNLYLSKNGDEKSIFIAMKDVPELQMGYIRKYRELEIQNKILEYIYPMYEQAKIEEQKSIPTLLIVDNAVAPTEKYAPKKAFIILFVFFLALFFYIPFVFRVDKILKMEKERNIIEEKEYKFYTKFVKNLYRIKL